MTPSAHALQREPGPGDVIELAPDRQFLTEPGHRRPR
jgi:hypothetical protein